jgi:hypothetical protein
MSYHHTRILAIIWKTGIFTYFEVVHIFFPVRAEEDHENA